MIDDDNYDSDGVGVPDDPDSPSGAHELSMDDAMDPDAVLKEILSGRADAGEAAADTPAAAGGAGGVDSAAYQELNEKYLRSLADLENFRKRHQRTSVEYRKFGHENAIRELLPVLDNLERAVSASGDAASEGLTQFIEGVRMIVGQFHNALRGLGVEPVPADGKIFDPELHEAVQEVSLPDQPQNGIVQVLEAGYKLHERLIRPAKVVVNKISGDAAAAPQPAEADGDDEPMDITPDDMAVAGDSAADPDTDSGEPTPPAPEPGE